MGLPIPWEKNGKEKKKKRKKKKEITAYSQKSIKYILQRAA